MGLFCPTPRTNRAMRPSAYRPPWSPCLCSKTYPMLESLRMASRDGRLECCGVQIGPRVAQCSRALAAVRRPRLVEGAGSSTGPFGHFQDEVAALCPSRGYPRLRQHNISAYLVWSWHVTLSIFLLLVIALKKCHVSLISQTNVRPVTPAPKVVKADPSAKSMLGSRSPFPGT